MAYFAVERNGSCIDHIDIVGDDGNLMFQNVKQMSYDEVRECTDLEEFVVAVMDATNRYFEASDEQTIVTLIDEDDIFIWSVIIGAGDNEGDLRYVLVDWNKDGKKYKYS